MEQVVAITQKADMPLSASRRFFLFSLFHLFHTFHGTERNKADSLGRLIRPLRASAPPVLMRGVSDGRNVLPVPGTVPLSGQPAADLSPPGRCAPSRPIKEKRLRDSCRPHAAAACRCPCHRTPEAGKRLALESPLAPQGENNRPGSVVPRSTESAGNP